MRRDSDIDSIGDLRHKRIGGYPGSAQQTLLRLILRRFLPDGDYTLLEMPPGTQLQGLESGSIDALLTYDQMALLAIENDVARVLVENPISKYVVDPLYGFPYVMSSDFVQQNPRAAKNIRDAMYEAVDFIKTNEREARAIMAAWSGVDSTIAANVNLWDQVKVEDIQRESMQALADIFHSAGVTEKRIDTSSLYLTEVDLR